MYNSRTQYLLIMKLDHLFFFFLNEGVVHPAPVLQTSDNPSSVSNINM